MTIEIEKLHDQFLKDFEKTYFHDEARQHNIELAKALEHGMIPTARVSGLGMFARSAAPTKQDMPRLESEKNDNKKDFRK